MHMPSLWQWLFILLIVVILFGAKRLPELGESIGKAIRGFKKAHDEPENLPPKEGTGEPLQSPGQSAAKLCPTCKQDMVGDFAFCPHCGQKVKT